MEPGIQSIKTFDRRLARQLILDELFDLSLYIRLRQISTSEVRETLDELITVERRHYSFWQEFFKMDISTLDPLRRVKLWLVLLVCRILGATAVDLILDAIEIYGVRKYLELWDYYKENPLGEAVRGILEDEFKHEDQIVTRLRERKINPDLVRNVFLGLNDGMIEILGAVNGFFASLGETKLVLVAGITTAVAGAFSMGAGAFVASSSEIEVKTTEKRKAQFFSEDESMSESEITPWTTAVVVGISYFFGAIFPIFPVLFGAGHAYPSAITGGLMILIISMILAFLSGMNIQKRVLSNVIIIVVAIGVTYLIGILVRTVWGIHI